MRLRFPQMQPSGELWKVNYLREVSNADSVLAGGGGWRLCFGAALVADLLIPSVQGHEHLLHWPWMQNRGNQASVFSHKPPIQWSHQEINLESGQVSGSNYIFTGNAGAQGHIKGHLREAISKTQTVRNHRINKLVSLTKKNRKEQKKGTQWEPMV